MLPLHVRVAQTVMMFIRSVKQLGLDFEMKKPTDRNNYKMQSHAENTDLNKPETFAMTRLGICWKLDELNRPKCFKNLENGQKSIGSIKE